MSGRDPRFEDERWAAAEAGLLENAVVRPRHPYAKADAEASSERAWGPVKNCIRDLNDYQPTT